MPESRPLNDAEQRLIDSALRLFAEKGYEGTSIREIIEQAGVTRPVLYYYYENKEALYRRLVEAILEDALDTYRRIVEEVPECRRRLDRLVGVSFERAEAAPHVVRLLLQVFFAPSRVAPALDTVRLWEERFALVVRIMEYPLPARSDIRQ